MSDKLFGSDAAETDDDGNSTETTDPFANSYELFVYLCKAKNSTDDGEDDEEADDQTTDSATDEEQPVSADDDDDDDDDSDSEDSQ